MYEIFFYKDKNGKEPIKEYIKNLAKRRDKDSRIKLNKIQDYIQILKLYGTHAGEPYIKHLDGQIWELRPLRDRILFFGRIDKSFILLHHFMKKTQKTPKQEIEKAIRNMNDFITRE
ncbi:MAG: type II toxin-antitoxin system RelE/ParE family toxin [Spirochaetaceae bacterium]|nr:type II toxin-antitoxin system RelE/ParE family toxin [Spirochaetaceae bacterium]